MLSALSPSLAVSLTSTILQCASLVNGSSSRTFLQACTKSSLVRCLHCGDGDGSLLLTSERSICAERRRERFRKFDRPRPVALKCCIGSCLVITIIGVIWFPLFLLSSANPALKPNPVLSCTTEIGISGFSPFYAATVDRSIPSSVNEEQVTIPCLMRAVPLSL